jgi:hypothetical protein
MKCHALAAIKVVYKVFHNSTIKASKLLSNGHFTIWHYSLNGGARMWKEILNLIFEKFPLREIFNCWLSYTMSQPVDLDTSIIFYFMMQSVGLAGLMLSIKESHEKLMSVNEDMEAQEHALVNI